MLSSSVKSANLGTAYKDYEELVRSLKDRELLKTILPYIEDYVSLMRDEDCFIFHVVKLDIIITELKKRSKSEEV